MHHDLAGKVALITGGSRGIGAAVARALAGARTDVAITHLNSRQAAEHVAAEMRALGVQGRPVRADQADPAAAPAVIRQVAEEFGRLDILVSNAAVAVLGPMDGPVSDGTAFDRQIRVNYTSIVAAAPGVMGRRTCRDDRDTREVLWPVTEPGLRRVSGTTRTQAFAAARRRLSWHSRQDRWAVARPVPGQVGSCGHPGRRHRYEQGGCHARDHRQ